MPKALKTSVKLNKYLFYDTNLRYASLFVLSLYNQELIYHGHHLSNQYSSIDHPAHVGKNGALVC